MSLRLSNSFTMVDTNHIILATTIKGVHKSLRKAIAKGQDPELVWKNHLANQHVLQNYASSMRDLATNHWPLLSSQDSDTCRITWIHNQILAYFHQGGKAHEWERDEKRRNKLGEGFSVCDPGLKNDTKQMNRLLVLDVGSCYNPFSRYENLDMIAIDIAPADKQVFKCDFLSVKLGDVNIFQDSEVVGLSRGGFKAVIFSFLLEYFPTTRQRYQCVKKAAEILEEDGLLVIVTPDSCHSTKNSRQLKDWRTGLGLMGLAKVTYEKTKHFHGLTYRKVSEQQSDLVVLEVAKKQSIAAEATEEYISDLFYIPQDFNQSDKEEKPKYVEITEEERENLIEDFLELPEI